MVTNLSPYDGGELFRIPNLWCFYSFEEFKKKNTYIYENIKPCFLISQKQPSKKPLTSALVQKTEEGHLWKVSFWGLLSFFDLINGSEHNLDVSLGAWS